MISTHLQLIKTYGYVGIFSSLMLGIFGLPVPDETILVFIGFLVLKGYFHPVLALVAAFLGSVCGITLSYLVGRYLGVRVLLKHGKYLHITPEKLTRAHQWFAKYGKWSLFGGYFLPGVRHLTALSAGGAGLEYRYFAQFAYSGGLLWVSVFLTLGYVVGEKWRKIAAVIQNYLWVLVIGVVVLSLAALLVYRIRQTPDHGKK